MKRLALLLGLAILSLSCARHDDIALWNKVIDMNLRIDRLEALCNRINTNIQLSTQSFPLLKTRILWKAYPLSLKTALKQAM